jgi:TonB family protein
LPAQRNLDVTSSPAIQAWEQPSRRRGSRYRSKAPLDVTVLRSGIPNTVPGRSTNLGESGVAAILAGELSPGEIVGVEIQLRTNGVPLRARALVRHHNKLRCGMEFVGLSGQQQLAIREWTREIKAEVESEEDTQVAKESSNTSSFGESEAVPGTPSKRRGGRWVLLLLVVAVLLVFSWWRWRRAWQTLESGLPGRAPSVVQPKAHVPADVMQQLVVHRVDPEYPAAARKEKLQGVIALDVIVGRDGSVVETHALNGPEILAQAAVAAMRWWRFEPYRVNGQPEVVETTVAMEFKP